MNNFEKVYKEAKEIREEYNAAEATGDKEAQAQSLKNQEAWWEKMKPKSKEFWFIYNAFEESMDNDNEMLNFTDNFKNIEETIACLMDNGITTFTFSSGWTDAIENVWNMQQAGCKVIGMTEINKRYDFFRGRYETTPALVLEIQ